MRTPPVDPAALAPFGPAQRERARPRQTFLQVLDEGSVRAAARLSPPPIASASPGAAPPRARGGRRALVTRTLRAEVIR